MNREQRHVAATKIQALWRGWYIRHLIDVNTARVGYNNKQSNVFLSESRLTVLIFRIVAKQHGVYGWRHAHVAAFGVRSSARAFL